MKLPNLNINRHDINATLQAFCDIWSNAIQMIAIIATTFAVTFVYVFSNIISKIPTEQSSSYTVVQLQETVNYSWDVSIDISTTLFLFWMMFLALRLAVRAYLKRQTTHNGEKVGTAKSQ
ncbi:hypothetical protein ACPV30_18380 [Photobacterium damselae]|uniref:hypothetical protein n=1 Tax=Photobacterium damselae TaxID=38293 RepID=UPI004067B97E